MKPPNRPGHGLDRDPALAATIPEALGNRREARAVRFSVRLEPSWRPPGGPGPVARSAGEGAGGVLRQRLPLPAGRACARDGPRYLLPARQARVRRVRRAVRSPARARPQAGAPAVLADGTAARAAAEAP